MLAARSVAAPPEISEADAHIFRRVRQAAARRETAPWAFHVAGPAGTREVTEHEARQDPARTSAGLTGSAEEFLEDGGSPGRDLPSRGYSKSDETQFHVRQT